MLPSFRKTCERSVEQKSTRLSKYWLWITGFSNEGRETSLKICLKLAMGQMATRYLKNPTVLVKGKRPDRQLWSPGGVASPFDPSLEMSWGWDPMSYSGFVGLKGVRSGKFSARSRKSAMLRRTVAVPKSCLSCTDHAAFARLRWSKRSRSARSVSDCSTSTLENQVHSRVVQNKWY